MARSGRICAIVGLALLAGATGVAQAEDTICTPEFYYATEAPPRVIPIDQARRETAIITRIDIETGRYREVLGDMDGQTIRQGAMKVVRPGSHQERSDFIAVDLEDGRLLHISLIDEGLPFTRVDADGLISSGGCVYEYELPK